MKKRVPMRNKKVTPKQENFCVEFLRTNKKADAYRIAFERPDLKILIAHKRAFDLLKRPHIISYLDYLRGHAIRRTNVTVEDVLQHWVDIALADPNELVQHRRTCCRWCYGIGFNYQWVEIIYYRECAKAIQTNKETPDGSGGFGFDGNRAPNSSCPVCFGEGVSQVFLADTRFLKGPAKLLYAGIKQTKDGLQILMRDQDDAMRNIGKFLNMFKDRESPTKPDMPIPVIAMLTNDPIEAGKIYQKIMNGN